MLAHTPSFADIKLAIVEPPGRASDDVHNIITRWLAVNMIQAK